MVGDEGSESDLDRWLAKMQEKIEYEEEQDFSPEVLAEHRDPYHQGRMENPNRTGRVHGSCGDTMEFYLSLQDDRIQTANFWTNGCGATIACGSRLTRLVEGLLIEKAKAVTDEDLNRMLGGLPPEYRHCATLAVMTLNTALEAPEKVMNTPDELLE